MIPRWLSLRPVVPRRWEEVTPEWMAQAIGLPVTGVEIVSKDDGTNRRARFGLSYERGDGPKTVFVKAHKAAHRWVHLRNGNLFGEARLFASGAELPVEHPHVYCAVPDYPRLDFLLVMEDIEDRGADPRDATRPLSVDQVASGLTGLAAMHRCYWNRTNPKLGWVKGWAPTKGWQVGLRRRTPLGLGRGRDLLTTSLTGVTGNWVVDQWARFVRTLPTGPQTLLHGDAHIGNTYVLPDGTTGFLDWQVVRRGHWSQDVGYFLVGSLTEADRRAHERGLLCTYLDALGHPQNVDDAWLRYRASQAYGLAIWLSTLGTDGWQTHEVSRALVGRYAAAFEELESLDALAKLSPI